MNHALRIVLGLGIVAIGSAMPTDAMAKPIAPREFCNVYADAPECMGRIISCEKCHTSTQPVTWNDYGGALYAALAGKNFENNLVEALADVEDLDSDGDGLTNLEEIELGTDPGDPLSSWMPRPEPTGDGNPRYAIGSYDPMFAFKRVNLLFCGSSPAYDAAAWFKGLDPEAQITALHDTLTQCLSSDYWITDALGELANPKIRPVRAYGADTTVELYGYRITIADYNWDYRLWRYVLTGDRDARELLTAQYHVVDDGAGGLRTIEGQIANPPEQFGGGQPLQTQYRAGMLTTQWNLFLNIMFAGIPRVAAGHAYREYLGLNLSLQEGVRPVEAEPLDIDNKGVAAPACAQCHSTLDPLAYAFAVYEGVDINAIDRTGTYRATRPEEHVPGWDVAAPQSVILDEPVTDLVDMARVMSESAEFQRNLTHVFWRYAVGHEPEPDEYPDFEALWTSLPGDGYSANRLLHRMIDTDAFGAP